MEKDVLAKLKMNSREDAVIFLRNLWGENPGPCPICGGKLEHLHKKAKKSNCDWLCTACNTRFDTIKILRDLNE